MKAAWLCMAMLALGGVCSCVDYPTGQEVQDEGDDWEGDGPVFDVVVVGVPEDVATLNYYVVPVLVSEPDCEGEACEVQLGCGDFIGPFASRSIFDYSHALIMRKELELDSVPRIDLVISGLPEGRMLVYLEAIGYGDIDPLAHGCGHGQGVLNQRSAIRIRLVDF